MLAEYRLHVVSGCPADHKLDCYDCVIRSSRTITAESIQEAVASFRERKLYQEDLTQELHRMLAAEVETIGWHSGVMVRVRCGGDH